MLLEGNMVAVKEEKHKAKSSRPMRYTTNATRLSANKSALSGSNPTRYVHVT